MLFFLSLNLYKNAPWYRKSKGNGKKHCDKNICGKTFKEKKCEKYLQSLKKCIQRVWVLHASALMNWLTKQLIIKLVYNVLFTMGQRKYIWNTRTKYWLLTNLQFVFNTGFQIFLKNVLENKMIRKTKYIFMSTKWISQRLLQV